MATAGSDRAKTLARLNLIVAASERLLADARASGREEVALDLHRIHQSGVQLRALLSEVLDMPTQERSRDPRTIRHELYTPLNHILGYTDLLLEEANAETTKAFVADVERIRSAARELLSLINTELLPVTAEPNAMDWNPTIDRATPSGEGASVLVVDDDPANLDVLERHLRPQGYRVLLAKDGREALDILAATRVDLILLDLLMPEMDGYETLRHLKADPELRSIPVIVISSLDELESVVWCIEMGAEDYVHKPFNPVLLNVRIGGCISRKRLRDREVMSLQARVFQRLDTLVAERTRELQEKNAELELMLNSIKKILDSRQGRVES